MFSWWTYFVCVVVLCHAAIETDNDDEFRPFIKQLADKQHSTTSTDSENIRETMVAVLQKLERLINNARDLKELTRDKVGFLVRNAKAKATEQNSPKILNQLETDDFYTMKNIFQILFDTAVSTASDVKTLLDRTEEIIATANKCNSDEDEPDSQLPRSCLELQNKGQSQSGVYRIYVASLQKAIEVFCDQETDGGGWIVFQRRQDGSVDFFRDWDDYKDGFGDPEGEFWLGLDTLHHLTTSVSHDLRIDLADAQGIRRYAKYRKFIVGSESSGYRLASEGVSGNAGNSFGKGSGYHNGQRFSTKDMDNDRNCADRSKGGWWYNSGICHLSNLNGLYLKGQHRRYDNGIIWYTWKGFSSSLTFTEMKIREKL